MAAWRNLTGYLVLKPAGDDSPDLAMTRNRSRSDSRKCSALQHLCNICGYLVSLSDIPATKIFEGIVVFNALSRLKVRKRLWFVFDESRCHLLYFKSESDDHTNKEPLGVINVRGAAISLVLHESNEFVIHSAGKEHVLIADSHESMMLWVSALQARQDSTGGNGIDDISILSSRARQKCSKNLFSGDVEVPSTANPSKKSSQMTSQYNKSKIMRTHSLQLPDKSKNKIERQHNPLMRMRSLWAGQSTDVECPLKDRYSGSTPSPPKTPTLETCEEVTSSQGPELSSPSTSSSSSSSSTASIAMTVTTENNHNDRKSLVKSPTELRLVEEGDSTDRSSDTESCDESDPSDCDDGVEIEAERKMRSPISLGGRGDRIRLLRKMNSEGIRPEDISPLKDRASSLSGTSVSSDSAMGTSECAHSTRVMDLESELMSSKCELAKALNRESAYKSIIEEKIVMLTELEERLKIFEDITDDSTNVSTQKIRTTSNHGNVKQKLQDTCRILQNHNRFLNEEVLKLSRMLQQEQSISQLKQLQIRKMGSENDQLKRDYVFLLQSSLRITNNDGPEIMEVYLYGGARHKERVLSLLEEARRINPTLPSYENLSRSLCHVDSLGFRRSCTDESLILHYICRQLHQHYSTLVPGYDLHQQNWKRHLRQYPTLPRTKELKTLVRLGVPAHLRSRVWAALYKSRVKDIMDDKGSHYYNYLCSLAPDDERVSQHKRQIALDLLRTMPDNIRFSDSAADGVRKMQEVLQAFCLHNPTLGYCQGMNFLVGMCLLFLDPEDAFWCLVAITERYFTPNYFDQNLIGAQADQEVLKDLLRERMPVLWHHLASLEIELCTVTLNWFLAIFFDCIPFETLLRIWDCFLLEGPKVLFRFSLAILKMNEKAILAKHDTVSIMRQLKAAAKLCFDVDSLFKTAFEGIKPFTRRQDIAAKQACYYKTLKEHAKKMEVEKVALKDREKMLSEMEVLGNNQLVIECAAVYDKDKLWLCHGHQNGAQITKVNCEENIMYRLNIELESRVMCMHCLDDDIMLLGMLSHFVHAYSTKSRRLIWETRLNDSVLALGSHEEDGIRQVYAGLADGTIAVIENIQGNMPKPETFYILIGSSPVTCIQLVDRRLWCGSGNRVVILSARTLDAVDQFQTSSSVLDYISMLVPDELGVWVTIRGSSVLQLWDSQNLTCKLLYDVKDNRYPRSPKQLEEESNVNQSRITAVLPFGGSVLVGTAEGSLIIYDIVTRLSRSASSSDFPNRRQLESSSVDHIQERIQELLLEQKKRDSADEKAITELRNRTDSGCYTTPSRTPHLILSRRESMHVPDCLPEPLEQEDCDQEESLEGSPEDQSEATSGSTVRRLGTDPSITSPESQPYGDCEDMSYHETTNATQSFEDHENSSPEIANNEHVEKNEIKHIEADKDDSGRSSSSAQGKFNDEDETSDIRLGIKRPCTCNQLGTTTVKCRHCLLETSESLRKLFSKYSLSTNSANHLDSTTRYYNLAKNSRSRNCSWHDKDIKEVSECKENDSEVNKNLDNSPHISDNSVDSKADINMINDKANLDKLEMGRVKKYSVEESSEENNINGHNLTKSLIEIGRSTNSSLLRAISADDVTRWIKSQESLTSSIGSDSYEFDDVFVTYTEDDSITGAGSPSIRFKSGIYHNKETEALLGSIRAQAILRRRSSNVCDYVASCGSSTASHRTGNWSPRMFKIKSRSASPWIDTSATSVSSCSAGRYTINSSELLNTRLKLLDIRTQFPQWNQDSMISESENGVCVQEKRSENISACNVTSPTNWLSYEDSVTENDSTVGKGDVVLNGDFLQLGEWSSGTHKGSDTASNVSFNSAEIPYIFELNLQEKIKISDKPIKCLLETRCGGEPTIISCAGCYGDDETVLKWTKLGDDKLWTNDPIIEVCPYTNAIKPSPYARSRLPRRTSSLASVQPESDPTSRASRSSVTSTSSSASSVVGSGLAKVQNMFLRVQEKV